MAILAGEIVSASRLGRMQPRLYDAACTATAGITTVETDVTGATITLTTEAANATYQVTGVFYFNQVATTNNDPQGKLSVDGVSSARIATFGGQVAGDEATTTQVWTGTLPSAGSHTLKLRTVAPANSQWEIVATHTVIQVLIFEVV